MAAARRAVFHAVAATMLSACLVTDEITFPEEVPYPPTIVDVPGSEIPIGTILWLDIDQRTGHPQNEWRIPVRIRDDNVDQELQTRYRVLREGSLLPPWTPDVIAPSGSPTREDYEVKVRFGDLRPGQCHRLELVVSGSFLRRTDPRFFDVLNDEGEMNGDIARASWTILEGSATTAFVDSCKAIPTFVHEPVVDEAP
jgi:hypothetical protein